MIIDSVLFPDCSSSFMSQRQKMSLLYMHVRLGDLAELCSLGLEARSGRYKWLGDLPYAEHGYALRGLLQIFAHARRNPDNMREDLVVAIARAEIAVLKAYYVDKAA